MYYKREAVPRFSRPDGARKKGTRPFKAALRPRALKSRECEGYGIRRFRLCFEGGKKQPKGGGRENEGNGGLA